MTNKIQIDAVLPINSDGLKHVKFRYLIYDNIKCDTTDLITNGDSGIYDEDKAGEIDGELRKHIVGLPDGIDVVYVRTQNWFYNNGKVIAGSISGIHTVHGLTTDGYYDDNIVATPLLRRQYDASEWTSHDKSGTVTITSSTPEMYIGDGKIISTDWMVKDVNNMVLPHFTRYNDKKNKEVMKYDLEELSSNGPVFICCRHNMGTGVSSNFGTIMVNAVTSKIELYTIRNLGPIEAMKELEFSFVPYSRRIKKLTIALFNADGSKLLKKDGETQITWTSGDIPLGQGHTISPKVLIDTYDIYPDLKYIAMTTVIAGAEDTTYENKIGLIPARYNRTKVFDPPKNVSTYNGTAPRLTTGVDTVGVFYADVMDNSNALLVPRLDVSGKSGKSGNLELHNYNYSTINGLTKVPDGTTGVSLTLPVNIIDINGDTVTATDYRLPAAPEYMTIANLNNKVTVVHTIIHNKTNTLHSVLAMYDYNIGTRKLLSPSTKSLLLPGVNNPVMSGSIAYDYYGISNTVHRFKYVAHETEDNAPLKLYDITISDDNFLEVSETKSIELGLTNEAGEPIVDGVSISGPMIYKDVISTFILAGKTVRDQEVISEVNIYHINNRWADMAVKDGHIKWENRAIDMGTETITDKITTGGLLFGSLTLGSLGNYNLGVFNTTKRYVVDNGIDDLDARIKTTRETMFMIDLHLDDVEKDARCKVIGMKDTHNYTYPSLISTRRMNYMFISDNATKDQVAHILYRDTETIIANTDPLTDIGGDLVASDGNVVTVRKLEPYDNVIVNGSGIVTWLFEDEVVSFSNQDLVVTTPGEGEYHIPVITMAGDGSYDIKNITVIPGLGDVTITEEVSFNSLTIYHGNDVKI